MAKNILIVALVFLAIYLIYHFFLSPPPAPGSLKTINLEIKSKNYTIEIARSLRQQAVGLSGRNSLCPNCGMIFPYSREGILTFWMKDTLIPLDMIWLDHQGKVVYIANAQPQIGAKINELKLYQNQNPAQYVIELNSGVTNRIKLNVGDVIDLSPLDSAK